MLDWSSWRHCHSCVVIVIEGDQKALTVGMTLHDRGKALVKKGDLKTAAQMYLRAESEGFSKWYLASVLVHPHPNALQPHTDPETHLQFARPLGHGGQLRFAVLGHRMDLLQASGPQQPQ